MKNKLMKLLTLLLSILTIVCFAFACTPDSGNVEPEHTHEYSSVVTMPTCLEKGYTTFTCECGDMYKGEEVDALGHLFTNYFSDGNATYNADGTKTAMCDREGCEEKNTITDLGSRLVSTLSFKTLTVASTNVKNEEKFANSVNEFSFSEEIELKGNGSFVVSNDKYGWNCFYTKTVPLNEGINIFYVFAEVDGVSTTYIVELYRNKMFTVSFNLGNGETIEDQTIEEDKLVTLPDEPEREGYTFDGWDYDFTAPVTSSMQISAKWSANTVQYKVEYYKQNLENDEYTLTEIVELSGKTDTIASAEEKSYSHFTINKNHVNSKLSGNINGDGSLVLRVYYTRDKYDINISRDNVKAGTFTDKSDNYKYGKEITVTATTNDGYTFLGWFDGNILSCETPSFTFVVEKEVTYTARWSINTVQYKVEYYKQNLENDEYTLTETVELSGKTDTIASAEEKSYSHFTINKNHADSKLFAYIAGDGSLTLKVYYTRNKYTLSSNMSEAGTVTNLGTYKYGEEDATSTVTVNRGYEFLGWYSGDMLLSSELTYVFTVDKDVVAMFKNCLEFFEYTMTETTCIIDRIKMEYVELPQIYIPSCVTSIGSGAFALCYVEEVIFGENSQLTEIGDSAFMDCNSLTSIKIPNSVTSMGSDVFGSCGLTNIEIPNNVTSIGWNQFLGCRSLISIVIPRSVIKIDGLAFTDCDSLTDVYYGGNADDWTDINIEHGNSDLTDATLYYYVENESDLPSDDGNYWHYVDGVPTVWEK